MQEQLPRAMPIRWKDQIVAQLVRDLQEEAHPVRGTSWGSLRTNLFCFENDDCEALDEDFRVWINVVGSRTNPNLNFNPNPKHSRE